MRSLIFLFTIFKLVLFFLSRTFTISTFSRIGSLVGAVQAHSNVYETDWLIALTSDHGGIETDKAPYVYNGMSHLFNFFYSTAYL
jgi:hypothetical protein